MKPTSTCLSLASAGIVMAASQPAAHSATVVRELAVEVVGYAYNDPLDVLFDPVDNVTDLVSISNGSVYTDEGGCTVEISAILANDSLVVIFFGNVARSTPPQSLETITGNTFTAFVDPVTVKGLRFNMEWSGGMRTTLPLGTTFTFAVPEPTAAMLSMAGLVMLGVRRRRP